MKSKYHTKSGRQIPITVEFKRLDRDTAMLFNNDKETRNGWCISGNKPCPQYDMRPCCPPRIPTFSRLSPKKYLYLLYLAIDTSEYFEEYPTQNKSAFMMTSTAGNYVHKIIKATFEKYLPEGGMIFKVNGCSGCSYKRTQKCNLLMPSLEGVGLNVADLCEKYFEPIQWLGKGKKFDRYTALGGFYTDQKLTPAELKESLKIVFKENEV